MSRVEKRRRKSRADKVERKRDNERTVLSQGRNGSSLKFMDPQAELRWQPNIMGSEGPYLEFLVDCQIPTS